MGMQVELFKALRSAKIGNEEAAAVVDELEGHIAMKISEATAPLIEKLESTGSELKSQVTSMKWTVSIALIVASLIVAVSNALN